MKRFRSDVFTRVMVFVLMSALIIPVNAGKVHAASTEIRHESISYFVPRHRIALEANITDPTGVKLVRCYFKAAGQADFVFVAMSPKEGSTYSGILPSIAKETKNLEYLFLVVNKSNEVTKTQLFTIPKKDGAEAPEWQQISSEGDITVATESDQATKAPPGFSDSIKMNIAESSARFGMVAGGLSTQQAIWAGIGAAALIGGIILLPDGGDDTIYIPPPPLPVDNGMTGTWEFHFKCAGRAGGEDFSVFQINILSPGDSLYGLGNANNYSLSETANISVSGTYDKLSHSLSGKTVIDFTGGSSYKREDNFGPIQIYPNIGNPPTIPVGYDSGYVRAQPAQSKGDCDIELKFIKTADLK